MYTIARYNIKRKIRTRFRWYSDLAKIGIESIYCIILQGLPRNVKQRSNLEGLGT